VVIGLVSSTVAAAVILGPVRPDPAGAASVRVGSGSNLTQIARTYGTSVRTLVALNDIADPNMVLVGTVLQIPPTSTAGSVPAAASGSTIVVSPGDTLWTISNRYGTTVSALAAANGIADPSHVTIGRHLTVPTAGSIGASAGGSGSSSVTGQGPGLPAALLAHPSRMALIPLFHQWADAYGVPRSLLEATCWWESGWQMAAVSSTGAVGVGQLEPSTVRTLRVILGDQTLSSTSTSDNIEMASAYLHQLLTQTGGNEALALAGYYQGLASVHQRGMMSSTVQYVHGILSYLPSFS